MAFCTDRQYLYHIPCIYDGLQTLLADDPVFRIWGLSPLDFPQAYYGAGFSALCRIVIGQQVSTAAADALWTRFAQGLSGDITPEAVLRYSADELRALGLSRQKIRYIFNLADSIKMGAFDPAALEDKSDSAVYDAVTALTGFGKWSAEIFLMFCLARPDIFPAGDLGIQEGLRRYYSLDSRPDAEQASLLGENFAPRRTAAAILLWHLKGMA